MEFRKQVAVIDLVDDDNSRPAFACQSCGWQARAWFARCCQCAAWSSTAKPPEARSRSSISRPALVRDSNTGRSQTTPEIVISRSDHDDRSIATPSSTPISITDVDVSAKETRIVTGIEPLDRVLGGGFVIGSMVLLGGMPGAGKSTLLMQMMAAAAHDHFVLYATGEESVAQVAMRARRVDAAQPNIKLVRETDLDGILWHARREQASVIVVDSIHTIRSSEVSGMPGSDYQVKICGQFLMAFAKDTGCIVVVISHINKEGDISGPMNFEHAGDATLMLGQSELGEPWRELRAIKNRFGSTAEVGMFQMANEGLVPVGYDAVPDRADTASRDQMEPVAQELLHRYLELGGIVDGGLRDRIAGRLDLNPRGSR